jgi:hypothetical protein
MLDRRYKQYKQLAKKITAGDERYIDLLHDVLIQLHTNEKWNNLETEKEQMYFLMRTLSNQFYSNNSKFQKTYRKFATEIIQIPDKRDEEYKETPTIEWVNDLLENELKTNPSNWYNVGLFKLYMENTKVETIHKKTHIQRYSIRATIKEMKAWVKQKWNEQWAE